MATTTSTHPQPLLNADDHHTTVSEETAITNQINNPPLTNLMASISDLRNLSTALSTFQRRYDELQQHLDFIQTTINSKLNNGASISPLTLTQSSTTSQSKSPIPITASPITTDVANKNSTKAPKSPSNLVKLEQKPAIKTPFTSRSIVTLPEKANALPEDSEPKPDTMQPSSKPKPDTKLPNYEPKPDTKLPNSEPKTDLADDAKPAKSELEQLCSTMCSRSLRRYFVIHLPELEKLRVEAPKALLCAPDPAKLVLECLGKFFLTGKKAYMRDSPAIAGREASIFALECFLLMGMDGIVIKDGVKEEAHKGAQAWRKRLQGEGGLTKASEADARGLLLLISCFGIPVMFKIEDIKDLICSSNVREISGALRRSPVLHAILPELIEGMLKNKKEIEAVDIVYTFEVQDKFPPKTILTSFLNKSDEILKKKRKASEVSSATVNEHKKHLADLKTLIKSLEDHKVDPSKSFPELEIIAKKSSLEKEIVVLDRKVKEDMTNKRKTQVVESSKRLKHTRPQLQNGTSRADGNRSYDRLTEMRLNGGIPGQNSYNASPSIPHGSGAGLLHEYPGVATAGSSGAGLLHEYAGMATAANSVPHGSGVGVGLLHEYAAVTSLGGGGGSVVDSVGGGILPTDPYVFSHRRTLVDTDLYHSPLYGWRADAATKERSVGQTFAGQSSVIGHNYSSSQSLEGFAGFPGRPSAAVSSRDSAFNLYSFADSVIESESRRGSASHSSGTLHRSAYPS